jgi:hypothetical protein
MARVWYRAVRTLLIRRRRPLGEPVATFPALFPGTAGAGRITLALTGLGFELDGVQQLAIDLGAPLDDLAALDLSSRFEVAILGSHLINVPDEALRAALLDLARRHLAAAAAGQPDRQVLVEHHPLDWATTAAPTAATAGGSQPGMVDVRREPPFVSAVSVYDVGGRVVRQPFRAQVLSDAELAAALDAAGLRVSRRLGPTWLEAVLRDG